MRFFRTLGQLAVTGTIVNITYHGLKVIYKGMFEEDEIHLEEKKFFQQLSPQEQLSHKELLLKNEVKRQLQREYLLGKYGLDPLTRDTFAAANVRMVFAEFPEIEKAMKQYAEEKSSHLFIKYKWKKKPETSLEILYKEEQDKLNQLRKTLEEESDSNDRSSPSPSG